MPCHTAIAPGIKNSAAAIASVRAPASWNQPRPSIASLTVLLNAEKRSLFFLRSSLIRSRKLDRCSVPPLRTSSTTFTIGRSKSVSDSPSAEPGLMSRSATCSLRSPPTSCAPCRRRGRVVAPANEVEERRRELERAHAEGLPQERRDERGGQLRRRFLLVLTVVAVPSLPSVQPPDHQRDDRRRTNASSRRTRIVSGRWSSAQSMRSRSRS